MNLYTKKIHTYKINLILCFIFTFFCSKIQSNLRTLPSELIYHIASNDKSVFCALREVSKKCKITLDENRDDARLYRWYVSGISDNRYIHIPLVWSVIKGHGYIFHRMLGMRNIDINAKDEFGMTALSYSCLWNHNKNVELLLKHDVDVNMGCFKKSVCTNLKKNESMPHYVRLEYLLIGNTLDDDLSCLDNYFKGYEGSPLMFSVLNNSKQIVQLLLNHTRIEVNKLDRFENTPLFFAVYKGRIKIIRLLLKHPKIKASNTNKKNNNPICLAIKKGDLRIVKAFVRYTSNRVKKKLIEKMLNYAIREMKTNIIQWLLRDHININGSNSCCSPLIGEVSLQASPLIKVIQIGNEEIVSLLLDHKNIDVNKEGLGQSTPLIKAIRMGNEKIITLLLNHKGIDINKKDSVGDTPLDVAKHYKRKKIVKRLKAKGAVCSEKKRSFFSWFKRKKS